MMNKRIALYNFFWLIAILCVAVNPLCARRKKSTPSAPVQLTAEQMEHSVDPDQTQEEGFEYGHELEAFQEHELPTIELNFDNADLANVANYIAELLDISFVTDDAVKPLMQGGKEVVGNKISFVSRYPMTKHEVLDLFTTFLDLAGLAMAPTPQKNIYRITSATESNKHALPTFIDVDPESLPNNDTKIRYVYFLKNATLETINPIVDQMRSPTSAFKAFAPLKALVITDNAYNIKTMMTILKELDKASMPETLSVLKLKRAAAEDVKKLYDELTKSQDQRGVMSRVFGNQKSTEALLFPEEMRVIAEPRTNSLVMLGPKDTIKRLEDFIKKHIDVELDVPDSPLYVYDLQHTDAESMAQILNKVSQYGMGAAVGATGGVRGGERYFKPINFYPEKSGNRLVIKGDYEDYLKAKEVIEKLDIMQPQVAIEVLIVDVTRVKEKQLGVQMRNRTETTIKAGVDFQNSGLPLKGGSASNVLINQDTGSIMTNLISLATNQSIGATMMSFGIGQNIWAMIKMLNNFTQTNIISNPFLVTANKFKATVLLGERRRILSSQVTSGGSTPLQSFKDDDANLKVEIEPQINDDGLITLDITIHIDEFLNPDDPNSATKTKKHVRTIATAANKEVIAIGGIIRDRAADSASRTPLLGSIPLIGWLFKSKSQRKEQDNLLIFISPEIIAPNLEGGVGDYTARKGEYARATTNLIDKVSEARDPVNRWFFAGSQAPAGPIDQFLEKQYSGGYVDMSHDYYKRKEGLDAFEKAEQQRVVAQRKKKKSLTDFVADAGGQEAT